MQDSVYIWAGIGINSDNQTVRWAESSVARLSAILLLWWYFYIHDLDKPGSFLTKLSQAGASAQYPGGKKALDQLIKGLTPVVKTGDKELSEKEISKRIEQRLKLLLSCARNETIQETPDTETDLTTEAAAIRSL